MKKIIIILTLLLFSNIYSQKEDVFLLSESFKLINNFQLDAALIHSSKSKNTQLNKLISLQISFLKNGKLNEKEIYFLNNLKPIDKTSKILLNINKGDYYLFNFLSKDNIAVDYYNTAYNLAINTKDSLLICESLKKLIYYTHKFNRNIENLNRYNKEHKKFAYNGNEEVINFINEIIYEIQFSEKNKTKINNIDFSSGIRKAKSINNKILEANIYHLMGVKFASLEHEFKKAIPYYKKAINGYKNYNNFSFVQHKTYNSYISLGAISFMLKDYKNAIKHLELAEKTPIINNKKRDAETLYFWFQNTYTQMNNHKKAYEYLKKEKKIIDSINQFRNNIKIAEIQTKYQTEKKEKENLQLKQDNLEIQQKRVQNKNFLIATLLSLILISIIGTLVIKNSNKKRKVAEQQKELEKQKNLTLLKEQEISIINAIVNGQEKERKQIAEDLHDNLGSVLATLKLHFENLKINREKKKIDQGTLFNKTEDLIDEAYLKVRSIAHAKNAGVIANQGLLMAVQMMAEKISSADKIKIEVIDFGLNKRLENNLEISIFRIIQELITNVIKHAEAKNATINISLYDKNLNIIIEDDGKGFDVKKIDLKNGMGISSIKTRIAHLKGTFNIDTTLGKGSSIIIDIPTE